MDKLPKRKEVRLKDYDYSSDGFYFVTICTHNKRPIIKKYRGVVEKVLLGLPRRFSGLTLNYYNLIPTHLHVIFVFDGVKVSLGQIVRTFKALVSKKTAENDFWQRNYYEHVIRTDKALSKIREYIRDNPLVEGIKLEQFYETGSMNRTPTDLKFKEEFL